MKNLLVLLSIISSFLFASCQKETIEEMAPAKVDLLDHHALITLESLANAKEFAKDSTGVWVMVHVATQCVVTEDHEYVDLSDYDNFLMSPKVYSKVDSLLKTRTIVAAVHQLNETPFGYIESIVSYED